MTALRVLISGVVLDQPMGGVRRHNAELLPRVAAILKETGGELAVLAGKEGLQLDLPDSVRVLTSSVPSRPILVRAARESSALVAACTSARESGRPFHVVHGGHLPAPRGLPVPMTLTVHDLRSLDLEHTPFSRRLVAKGVIGRALDRSARVFAVSNTTAERLRSGWPTVEPKLVVAPNGADHLQVLPRSPGPDAPLLHVGHVEPRKNLELLLHALALDPGLPDLLLVGAPKGGEEERLRSLAESQGLSQRVHFQGPCDEKELPRLFATCAAVVLPSHLEGFGIVALEAQLARAPLAVSSAGALPEVAGEGVPLFAPDDPAACVTAIRQALESPPERLEEHARRAARYSWEDTAKILVETWRSLAANGS